MFVKDVLLSRFVKISYCGLLALCAAGAQAVDYPTAGGDIATANGWGGTLPGAADAVAFTQGGTYTASADVAFGSIEIKTVDAPAVFDFRVPEGETPRVLTLGSMLEKTAFVFSQPVNDASAILKGGIWDLKGNSAYLGKDESGGKNRRLTLQDGAVITNVSKFYVASREGGNVLAVTNATLQAATFFAASGRMDSKSYTLVGPGGRILAGTFNADASITSNSKVVPEIRFEGEGAILKASTANICYGLPNSGFTAGDGALVDVSKFYMATSNNIKGAYGSRAVIRDNAKLKVKNAFRLALVHEMHDTGLTITNATFESTASSDAVLGFGTASYDNFIDSIDSQFTAPFLCVGGGEGAHHNVLRVIGGSVDLTTLEVGYATGANENLAVFSNCTAEVNNFFLGTEGGESISNRVVVAGPQTRFVLANTGKGAPVMRGREPILHITDGATFTNANTRQLFQSPCGATILVDNGGRWEMANPLHIGLTEEWEVSDPTNRFIVGKGGNLISTTGVNVREVNTELVLEDGTIRSSGISVGYRQYDTDPQPTNCAFIVKGALAKATISSFSVTGVGSRVQFVPGATAWAEAPVQVSKDAKFAETSVLTVDPAAYLAANREDAEIPLLTVTGSGYSLTLPDAVLEAANRSFTGRGSACSLYVKDKTLFLSARHRGAMLILR